MSISLSHLSKRYGKTHAVEDVSAEITHGSLTAILGPSGSGKSTLLKLISGLEHPDEGSVAIDGEDVTNVDPRHRDIGFCFQHYAPFRHMNVSKNVAFGLKVRKRPKNEIDERVDELLALVKLENKAKSFPSQLSGGERQRMALARALAIEPRVLLLDEPFGALDAVVRAELRHWVKELHAQIHVTTVLVTHDQEEAMEVADHLAVINHGRLEQVGTPRELYDRPVNEFVLTFVGPATTIRGEYFRPHDVSVSRTPVPGSHPATVLRVAHLGFEVRVEVRLDAEHDGDGQEHFAWAQLDRDTANLLSLEPGDRVHVLPAEATNGATTRDGVADEPAPSPA